jgi:hypothetical protein
MTEVKIKANEINMKGRFIFKVEGINRRILLQCILKKCVGQNVVVITFLTGNDKTNKILNLNTK